MAEYLWSGPNNDEWCPENDLTWQTEQAVFHKYKNDLLEYRKVNDFDWPKDLPSGVAFWRGSRITKEAFYDPNKP